MNPATAVRASAPHRSQNGSLISSDDVEFYRTNGFLRINRPVFTAENLREIQQPLDRLFNDFDALPQEWRSNLGFGTPGKKIHEICYTAKVVPELRRSQVYAIIRKIACELLQVDHVMLHFDHAIFKPAGSAANTAWHQDVVFDPDFDCPMTTMWIPMQAVDEHNGCMQFVSTAVNNEVLPHEAVGVNGRGAINPPLESKVVCPLPLGGLTVHAARTLHGAGPNLSDGTRRAWIVKFIEDTRPTHKRAAAAVRSERTMDRVLKLPLQERLAQGLENRY